MNSGILHQIESGKYKYYTDLTLMELDNFLNELEMGKYYRNKKKTDKAQLTEEQIKSIVELYKPSKIGKFFMQYFTKLYNFFEGGERTAQLVVLLSMTEDKVIELENKYYFA